MAGRWRWGTLLWHPSPTGTPPRTAPLTLARSRTVTALSDPRRLFGNLLQLGAVEPVDLAHASCRVRVGDLVTGDLPWLTPRAAATRVWSPPLAGEQVLLLCPEGDVGSGLVLPDLFSDAHSAPASDRRDLITWSDGAELVYDAEGGGLVLKLEDTERAINAMARAGKNGAFGIKDLARYFPQLSAAYLALGQNGIKAVADLSAALQITYKGAGQAEPAAINLAKILQKINTPQTIKNFQEMGVDLPAALKQAYRDGNSPIVALAELTNNAEWADDRALPEAARIGRGWLVNHYGRLVKDVDRAWATMLAELGLPSGREWRPYLLRHSLATLARNRGAARWYLEGFIGHRASGQTETYAIGEFHGGECLDQHHRRAGARRAWSAAPELHRSNRCRDRRRGGLNVSMRTRKAGAAYRTRTCDPIITNDVLYQLS